MLLYDVLNALFSMLITRHEHSCCMNERWRETIIYHDQPEGGAKGPACEQQGNYELCCKKGNTIKCLNVLMLQSQRWDKSRPSGTKDNINISWKRRYRLITIMKLF